MVAVALRHTAGVGLEPTGEKFEECGLAVAVAADDADAVALVEADRDLVENHAGGVLEVQRFSAEKVCHIAYEFTGDAVT